MKCYVDSVVVMLLSSSFLEHAMFSKVYIGGYYQNYLKFLKSTKIG